MKMWIKLLKEWKGKAAGEVVQVDESVGQTLVDTGFGEKAQDPTKDIVKEAADAIDQRIKEAAEAAAEGVIAKLAKSGGGGASKGKGIVITGQHDNELDDPYLGFGSAKGFMMTLAVAVGAKDHRGGKAAITQEEAHKRIKGEGGYIRKVIAALDQKGASGMNEAVDSDGAILLMPEISAELLRTEAQVVNVRNYATNFPISGLTYEMPALVDKDHSTAGGVTGGVIVTRKGEAVPPDSTKAKFEKITWKVTKQTGLTYLTEELLADAVALAGLMPQLFGTAMDVAESADFLTDGSGAGEPLGAFHDNNPALVVVAAEAGQTAGTLVVKNALRMRSRCYDFANAIWIGNQDIIPEIATWTIGNIPVYLPSMQEDVPDRILGRPVVWSEHASTLGTKNDLMLGSFKHYGIANRTGIESSQSIHVRFTQGETALRFIRRNDGRPRWRAPLTPIKGQTRSPFVTLATRS